MRIEVFERSETRDRYSLDRFVFDVLWHHRAQGLLKPILGRRAWVSGLTAFDIADLDFADACMLGQLAAGKPSLSSRPAEPLAKRGEFGPPINLLLRVQI